MRLLLTVSGIGDRVVEAGANATVAELVAAIDPSPSATIRTLRVERRGAVLAPHVPLSKLDLRSGDRVSLVEIGPDTTLDEGPDPSADPAVSLRMLTGPLAGETFRLGPGTHTIGRASRNDLVLRDPGLSRRHATLFVDASTVVVTDLGATNGIRIEGLPIDGPTALRSGQRLLLGQSWVSVEHHSVPVAPVDGLVTFDRPQRLTSTYPGRTFQVPAPPELGQSTGPIGQLTGRVHQRQVSHSYDRVIDQVVADLALGRRQEREARLKESPSIDDVLLAVRARTRLWERRLTDPDVLQVRLGLAELSTRHRVEVEPGGAPGLRTRIDRLPRTYGTIDGVPATVDLGRPGGLTLRGPLARTRELAAALIGQLVGLNPPDQLGVVLLGDARAEWDWLKWLPHADLFGIGHPPTGDEALELVAAFLDANGGDDAPDIHRPPYLVVIVDDSTAAGGDGSAATSELVRLMASGAERGLHPLLITGDVEVIPLAASGLFGSTVTVDGQIGRLAVRGDLMQIVEPLALEMARPDTVIELARLLTSLVMRGDVEPESEPDNGPEPGAGDGLLAVRPLTLGPPPSEAEPMSEEGAPQADESLVDGSAAEVSAADDPLGDDLAADEEDHAEPAERKDLPDLLDLPRSADDSRLILGTFRMAAGVEDSFLAFSPPRDGTLGLVGSAEADAHRCLVTVAAAAIRIDVPTAELPAVYALGIGDHLESLGVLPNVRRVASADPEEAADGEDPADPEEAVELLNELEQLMADRLLTLELAGVDTISEFREARPGVSLRRVLVLLDGLDRLARVLDVSYPGRTRQVVGQLLELGSGLGVHLAFTAGSQDGVDPLLVPKVGRWLDIGDDPESPARVVLDGAEVHFAVPGGFWRPDEIEKGLIQLAAEVAEGAS